jgi:HPt (histidine-containing phosphotransfer) domain-containing protein
MGSPVFDYTGSLRRMGNDPSLFQEMVLLFKEDAPQYLSSIQHTAANGDFGSLKRAVHTLKGLVLNFGATRATSAAIALELVAESALSEPGEQFNLRAAMEELEAAVEELLHALDRSGASPAAPHTQSISSQPTSLRNPSRSAKH